MENGDRQPLAIYWKFPMNVISNQTLNASIAQFKRQYFCTKASIFFFNSLYLVSGLSRYIVAFTPESKIFLSLLGKGIDSDVGWVRFHCAKYARSVNNL